MGIEALGGTAFLNLLTTQLKYQDPIKPMDSTAFLAQLAQFRELESAIETSKKLDTLVDRTHTLNSLSAAGLLGKKVEVNGGGMTHEAGTSETISYSLPAERSGVLIYVNDQAGNLIRTLTVKGLQNAGAHELLWDGKDNRGHPVPSGNYTYDGVSTTAEGKPMPLEINTKGEVTGISYKDGKVLALVNGTYIPVGEIVKISR